MSDAESAQTLPPDIRDRGHRHGLTGAQAALGLPAGVVPRTHENCGGCCREGRCHFCAGLSSGQYVAKCNGQTYFACAAHREMLVKSVRTDYRCARPDAAARPVSPLLS